MTSWHSSQTRIFSDVGIRDDVIALATDAKPGIFEMDILFLDYKGNSNNNDQ
jgi:hypothetical protein